MFHLIESMINMYYVFLSFFLNQNELNQNDKNVYSSGRIISGILLNFYTLDHFEI